MGHLNLKTYFGQVWVQPGGHAGVAAGSPAVAMAFFVFAVLGGGGLIVWVLLTDRRVARERRQDPGG